jgi:PAS domain S-box-containing protein
LGYLVTSLDGTIRKVNSIAAKLLDCSERNLIGRSLALFVPEGQRREFRAQIGQLSELDGIQEKTLTMLSWEHSSFKANLTVVAVRGKNSTRAVALHWLIRDITNQEKDLPALQERAAGMGLVASATPDDARTADDHPTDGEVDSLARKRFTFLANASIQLMLAQDLEATFGHVAHVAVPELADACIIDLADAQNENIQRLVVMREPKTQESVRTWRRTFTPEKRANTSRSAARWQPPVAARLSDSVDISRREELESILDRLDPASAIVAPLQYGGRQIGSLTLIGSKTSRQYDSVDVALIEELACQMSHAAARLHR